MDSTVTGSAQCLGSLPPSLLRGMELRRVKSVVESPEAPPGCGSPCPDAPPCVESSEGPEPSGAGSSDCDEPSKGLEASDVVEGSDCDAPSVAVPAAGAARAGGAASS